MNQVEDKVLKNKYTKNKLEQVLSTYKFLYITVGNLRSLAYLFNCNLNCPGLRLFIKLVKGSYILSHGTIYPYQINIIEIFTVF